ncbi:MAG: hypothetical protein RL518_2148 [Pseudomonadota bacterium]
MEAAIILPILLLVVFASIFFFILAARHFSLQMLANEIAKDISLSLNPPSTVATSRQGACACNNANTPTEPKLNVQDLLNERYRNTNGCWRNCAQRYLLKTAPTVQEGNQTSGLQISLLAHPALQWFDAAPSGEQSIQNAAVGDFIEVQLTYPMQDILGGSIAMFGTVGANMNLGGSAITVLERPEGSTGTPN